MTETTHIRSNIPEIMRKMRAFDRMVTNHSIRDAFYAVMDMVAFHSASKYFIHNRMSEAVLSPAHPSKPTVRTGRLLGSIVGARRFTSTSLPTEIDDMLGRRPPSSGAGFGGGARESIRTVRRTGSTYLVEMGTEVPYASNPRLELPGGGGKRPYLYPAAVDKLKESERIIEASIEKAFKDQRI